MAGIDARLDQWIVQPGESFTAFMEQEVAAANFVIVVCTPSYARKSNKRQGGVGYEQQIVSGRLMSGTARSKFIPILRKGEYEPGPDCAIPTHFLGIAWIEFRNDAAFKESLEDLIRVIFSKPRFAPPPLGARPSLETITATMLNRVGLTESDGSRELPDLDIEKGGSVKANLEAADIKLKPGDADAHYNRGVAYSDKGAYDQPVADYTRVTDGELDDADAYYNRGLAEEQRQRELEEKRRKEEELAEEQRKREFEEKRRREEQQREEAQRPRELEEKPHKEEQRQADAYFNRGLTYGEKGDYDRALAEYTRAIELKPDYAMAYYNRGGAYLAKGDKDRAIAEYTKAIELKPDYAEAYNYRGLAYNIKGDKYRAIAEHTKAIELKPDYAEAYYYRGLAYSLKEENARALADFNRAIELDPDYADAYDSRKEIYLFRGNFFRAFTDWRKSRKY